MSFFYLPLYSLISLTMVKTLQISKHLYDNFSRPSWFVQRSCCSLLEVIYFLPICYNYFTFTHIKCNQFDFQKIYTKGLFVWIVEQDKYSTKFSSAVKCLGGFNRGSIFSFYNLHLLYASGETCLLLEPIILKRGKRNTR